MVKIVDARGLACPQPVIMAKNALKELTEGELAVLVDDEIAVQNLMKLGGYSGLETSSERLGNKEFRVTFQLGEGEKAPAPAAEPDSSRLAGTVVVISADHMGEGDEVLGKILMKGFVYALTQMDSLPETILLYNGGARLSVEGSEALEDLKSLEAQGVEILTCGTCLNHYGLSEKLAVGGVTNMYAIAEKLVFARSVVRP